MGGWVDGWMGGWMGWVREWRVGRWRVERWMGWGVEWTSSYIVIRPVSCVCLRVRIRVELKTCWSRANALTRGKG